MTPLELREQRKALGLSQAALAAILDVRQATVSDWENGKHEIPAMLDFAMAYLHDNLEEYATAYLGQWPTRGEQ